jgi:hypothetical protein
MFIGSENKLTPKRVCSAVWLVLPLVLDLGFKLIGVGSSRAAATDVGFARASI